MSIASARLTMTQLCSIERDVNAGNLNARGNPATPDWQPITTDVPCRAWMTAGVATRTERVVDDVIADFGDVRLLLPIGTDVTERDRVGDITDRGAIYIAGPIGVRAVMRQRDFLELILVRITG